MEKELCCVTRGALIKVVEPHRPTQTMKAEEATPALSSKTLGRVFLAEGLA